VALTTLIVPGPERAAAYGSTRPDARVRTSAVGATRTLPRDADTDAGSSGYDASRLSRTTFGEPQRGLPFLAQQLAQTDAPSSTESDVAPALRLSALRAYGVAHESTIEFLSPTQHYDVRV
jgi:hypothetical protein